MIQSIFRVIVFACQNFIRNFWLSLATMTVIIIMLILVNIIIAINEIKIATLKGIEQNIDISLDFKPIISEAEVLETRELLLNDKRIDTVTVITPEENLKRFTLRYPEIGSKVVPILDKNPLGYTLKIVAVNVNDYSTILGEIEGNEQYVLKLENAPQFTDFRLLTNKASAISEKINIAVFLLTGIFFIIALIIIFNTIRVSIYTHREEIGIMRLVGASNWFIRMPYLIEALLYSLISIIILISIIFGVLNFLQPMIDRFFADFVTINLIEFYSKNFMIVFGAQLLVILATNLISTTIAIRRYLKV